MKNSLPRFFAGLLASMIVCSLLLVPALATSDSDSIPKWDGITIDVSWYSKTATEFYISTPAQLTGLAAIVNGIYNKDIITVIGDASCIVDNYNTAGQENGSSNKSTASYHYGADDFNGKTVYLTTDLDMGGIYNVTTGTWNGPNYMPIGGQYLMTENDSATKLSSSFCGTLNGQDHTVYNIYCQRRCSNGNFGDGQSVGLIGRLGVHDNDPADTRPVDPAVRNLAVTGYIYANRSVGGIVGKIGKTSYNNGDNSTGGIIENCANFATVSNTDAKGCGGICGSAWNGGVIRNCYNAGKISSTYTCPTGGIAGSNEITLVNCYSVGSVSAVRDSYAMGLGTNNGGAPYKTAIENCWYLDGSAPGGGYYSSTSPVNDGVKTSEEMKSAEFAALLGEAFAQDTSGVNNGYPILIWQKDIKTPLLSSWPDVLVSDWYFEAVGYVMSEQLFDLTDDNEFAPDSPMNRAMLVTALYRLDGSPGVTASPEFLDVDSSADYADAVSWAYSNSIVTGVSDTSFAPGNSITREQIAAMLMRYAEYAGYNTTIAGDLTVFSDNGNVSVWASESVAWAVGQKLISGMGNGTFVPQGTATRAQVAQIFLSFTENVSPE